MKSPRPSKMRNVVGLLFLIMMVVVINIIPAATLTKPVLEAMLQQVSTQISQVANQKEMKASFAYDAINFRGWGLSREAYVRNPRIELSEENSPDKLTITTEAAIIKADSRTPSILYVTMPQPLLFVEQGKTLGRIEFPDAPVYRYEPFSENAVRMQRHRVALPPSFKIITDASDPSAKPLNISYGEDPFIQVVYDPALKHEVSEYRIKSLMIDDGNAQIKIGNITSVASQTFDGENHVVSDYDINLQDVLLPEQFSFLGALSLEAKLHYNGEADASPLTDTPRSGMNEMTINKFNLLTSHFSGSAMGKLNRSADDSLPYGKIDFSVVNLRQALEEAQLNDEQRALWASTLQKITGQTLEAMDNSTFSFVREKHGDFHIGNASLQEVASLFFADYMKEVVIQDTTQQPNPASSEPPSNAVPAVPVTIPPISTDEGDVPESSTPSTPSKPSAPPAP